MSKNKAANEGTRGKESASTSQEHYRPPNARRLEQPKSSAENYNRKVPANDPDLCVLCQNANPNRWVDHRTAECNFLTAPSNQGKIDVKKRWEVLETNKVCLSCLSRNHHGKECPKPTGFCETCQARHSRDLPCKGDSLEETQEVACIRPIVPETPTAVRAIVEPA